MFALVSAPAEYVEGVTLPYKKTTSTLKGMTRQVIRKRRTAYKEKTVSFSRNGSAAILKWVGSYFI